MFYIFYYGFWGCLILFALWSSWAGGTSERWAVAMMCLAAVLTPIVGTAFDAHWRHPEPGVLVVDCLLLIGLLALALKSHRFWPLTVASLQLIAVLTHPALWIDPAILPFGYALMQGFWAYPMMAIVALGAWRHWQRAAHSERIRAERSAGTIARGPRRTGR
jgi:hypothetical protein